MKTITTLCLVFVATLLFGNNNTTISNAAALNVSGKQRMLTQRIAKCYIYEAAGENIETSSREKRKSILLFEENLRLLNLYASTKNIQNKLRKIGITWKEYKAVVESETSELNIKKTLAINSQLLKESDEVVLALEQYIEEHLGEKKEDMKLALTIDISGKQCMLSQRFALYYMAYHAGYTNEKDRDQLKYAYKEFDTALSKLIINPANTIKIDDQLVEVLGLWKKIRDNYQDFLKKKIAPSQVYDDFNVIMDHMNIVTSYYAELSTL